MARSAFLHPFVSPVRERFCKIVRGEGALVWDDQGRKLIDAVASLWYCNIGHGRSEMASAIADQLRTLEAYNCFDRFTNEPAEELCEKLVAIAPDAASRIFLTTSGSEAVDSAIKLARAAMIRSGQPERQLVVGREHSYHGVTYGGMSLQGIVANREGFGPLVEGITHVPHDDLGPLEALFEDRGPEIAAVVAEPVMGAGGVHPPLPGYLEGLRALCDAHGAFLVFDEVICGFGRLGEWWGADRFGVRPDMQTFAKGVTSGYLPLGGVVVGPAVLDPLEADGDLVLRHGHTYSGHPACCKAGLVNLDVIEREGLLAEAERIGSFLGPALNQLVAEGLLAEVRGEEAMWGMTVASDLDAAGVANAALERGVIFRNLGSETLVLCPPLVIGDGELAQCVQVLGEALRHS